MSPSDPTHEEYIVTSVLDATGPLPACEECGGTLEHERRCSRRSRGGMKRSELPSTIVRRRCDGSQMLASEAEHPWTLQDKAVCPHCKRVFDAPGYRLPRHVRSTR